ncbi:hypothetical protein C8J57DRAFT_1716576 [Mycena rebaudengoi]|nr:hypothetical protein C8J57DRAFT_1716576 [Mycena rebaudengoi]
MKSSTFAALFSTLSVASATYLESDILAFRGPNHNLFRRQNGSQPTSNLTNPQLVVAYQAQCAAATSATGQAAIQADIGNATNNAIAITQSFTEIYAKLLVIDSENLNCGKLFAPTWNSINQNWTDILWASRTMASNTAAYCNEFTTTIMPLVTNFTAPIPVGISVEVLQNYSAMADTLASQAQNTSEAFSAIIDALTDFTATFQLFAVNQSSVDQGALDTLTSDVIALKASIKTYNKLIILDGVEIATTAVITVATMAVLPGFSVFIIAAAATALDFEIKDLKAVISKRDAAQATLDQDTPQIVSLTNELELIAQANYTLGNIQNSTSVMEDQLDAFTDIWNAVKSDCESVIEYIQFLNTTIPEVYWATQNNVNCVYESLEVALIDYATGITNSGIPPPNSKRELVSDDFSAQLHADTAALVAVALAKANQL